MRRGPALAAAASLLVAGVAAGAAPPGTGRGGIELHGRVVLDNFSSRLGNPAVAFDHWRHRAWYTCRVCHVDVGFATAAGETRVSASTNEDGQHCGACHDGKKQHDGRPIFRACSGWPRVDAARGCLRCHTGGTDDPRPAYDALARRLPVDAGGFIDWTAAIRQERITPVDTVEGVSLKRPTMRINRDVTIDAKGTWLGDVTFSHRRHASLNGCELCHPEVFPVTQRGSTRFRMSDVQAGQYCGVCHRNVAFPLDACPRCHGSGARDHAMR
jgi:c(7)-type cytochrome triheme protein